MSPQLVMGANTALSRDLGPVEVGVSWDDRDLDIDVIALACGADRQLLSDGHFVYWGAPASGDGSVFIRSVPPGEESPTTDRAQVLLNLAELDQDVHHVYVALANVADAGTLRGVQGLSVALRDLTLAAEVATYARVGEYETETCVVLAELYRRGDDWKLRIVDQGYEGGLAALGRDHGANIE